MAVGGKKPKFLYSSNLVKQLLYLEIQEMPGGTIKARLRFSRALEKAASVLHKGFLAKSNLIED